MPNGAEPITDADRARFAELHSRGLGRNDIARELQRSPSTVTKLARAAGVTFDRTATAAATAAKQLDNRARRAALESGLLDDAEYLRGKLRKPYTVWAFGGIANEFNTAELDEPDAKATRELMSAVAQAVTSSVALAKVDQDAGVDHARSVLGQLGDALRQVAGEPEPSPVATGDA